MTVVALEGRVLETFDPIVSETVAHNMAQDGIAMHLPFAVASLERQADGIAVVCRGWQRPHRFRYRAMGRRPRREYR